MESVPNRQKEQGAELRSLFAAQELETLEDIVLAPQVGVDIEGANDMIDGGSCLKLGGQSVG